MECVDPRCRARRPGPAPAMLEGAGTDREVSGRQCHRMSHSCRGTSTWAGRRCHRMSHSGRFRRRKREGDVTQCHTLDEHFDGCGRAMSQNVTLPAVSSTSREGDVTQCHTPGEHFNVCRRAMSQNATVFTELTLAPLREATRTDVALRHGLCTRPVRMLEKRRKTATLRHSSARQVSLACPRNSRSPSHFKIRSSEVTADVIVTTPGQRGVADPRGKRPLSSPTLVHCSRPGAR